MARSPGSRTDPIETPADGSASTRRLPQLFVESSSGFASSAPLPVGEEAGPTQPTIARPRLIVLEETRSGVADALARLGYLVRAASTGVEVLSMCSEQAPTAVVVGPGDPERRRVLTSALRLRHADVAVVYVVAAGDAVRGEGVQAVLSWPLPSASEVKRAIPWSPSPSPSPSAVTRVVPPAARLVARSRSELPELSADASATGPVEALAWSPDPVDDDGPATLPSVRVELSAGEATESGLEPRSEVWREAAPLIWRLDEAARFLDELARRVTGAAAHAETVRAAARWMANLQRDDDG